MNFSECLHVGNMYLFCLTFPCSINSVHLLVGNILLHSHARLCAFLSDSWRMIGNEGVRGGATQQMLSYQTLCSFALYLQLPESPGQQGVSGSEHLV